MTQLNEAINNDVEQQDTWLKGNKLSLNVVKTNSMLITTKQKHNILKDRDEGLQVKFHDEELELAKKMNYLVVHIDSSLDWKEHNKLVSSKVSSSLSSLKYAKSLLPLERLKILSTGIVKRHFQYCCSVWG